jgi:hypothetical protein
MREKSHQPKLQLRHTDQLRRRERYRQNSLPPKS